MNNRWNNPLNNLMNNQTNNRWNNRWNNIRTLSRLKNGCDGIIQAIIIDPGVFMVFLFQSIIVLYDPYIFPFCFIAISVELLNTAIEQLCDHICPSKYNVAIKDIKDISAAATMISQSIPLILIFVNTFIF